MSSLPALETSNVTQVLLGGCRGVGTALTAVTSIPISILRPTVVVSTSSRMRMSSMVMSSMGMSVSS